MPDDTDPIDDAASPPGDTDPADAPHGDTGPTDDPESVFDDPDPASGETGAAADGGDAAAATDATDATATTGTDGDPKTIQRAVTAIRREGYKAAVLHAAVDAVAVLMLCYFVTARVEGATLPAVGPVPGTLALGGVAAVVTFTVEVWVRVRWYTLERFEQANPVVADALRTARDAADAEQASLMARRLYRDVTARLAETDATVFVHTRWLVVSVVLVVVLSGATLGTAVAGVSFSFDAANATGAGGPGAGGGTGPGGTSGSATSDTQASEDSSDQLQSGDEVLGELKDPSSGTESVNASVDTSQGGAGDGDQSRQIYDEGTGSGDTDIEAQQAGFEADRNLEDADLVRDYNLRLQARDDDDT